MDLSQITEGFFWFTDGEQSHAVMVEEVHGGFIATRIIPKTYWRVILDDKCAGLIKSITPIPDKPPENNQRQTGTPSQNQMARPIPHPADDSGCSLKCPYLHDGRCSAYQCDIDDARCPQCLYDFPREEN